MIGESISNSDIFLWALFELDGADKFVDVEEVFLRAFKLAPQRLSWRTRPDVCDLKKCAKSLQEAEARTPRLLVKQGPYHRRLTVEGQQWIAANLDRLAEAIDRDEPIQAPKTRFSSRLIAEAMRSEAFMQWTVSHEVPREKWRLAEILRCSPDSARNVWVTRLAELRSAAYVAGRQELLGFLDAMSEQRPDWF
jgi:predicted transcriptional regulator